MSTVHERTTHPPTPIEFPTAQHIFKHHDRIYEATVVHASLDEWRRSPLSSDPHWSADITGTRVCAIRLRF